MEPFQVDPEMVTLLGEMSNDDLRSFAELHEDPINEMQIDLCMFAYSLLFTRTRSKEHLEKAAQRAEVRVVVTTLDDPDRARRSELIGTMLARIYELMDTLEELLSARLEEG